MKTKLHFIGKRLVAHGKRLFPVLRLSFTILLIALAMAGCEENDDSELRDELKNKSERLAVLKTFTEAKESGDFVTDVRGSESGSYSVTFLSGGQVDISAGVLSGVDNTDPDAVAFTLADDDDNPGNDITVRLPKFRSLSIAFAQPAAFTPGGQPATTPATVTGVRGAPVTITAVDVPRGWTVGFVQPAGTVSGSYAMGIKITPPAADGTRYTAAGTATLLVSDGKERTIIAPLALSCSSYVPPTALDIEFTPATVTQYETLTVPFTLTGNVNDVVVAPPAGWTVAVTRDGSVGSFTITTAGSTDGEAKAFVFDDAGNVAMRPLPLAVTPFYAASTDTWTYGTQTWSDAIHIPNCANTGFEGSTTDPKCRSYTDGSDIWYYYNWTYVDENADALCPSPWRVPTAADFEALVDATDYNMLYNNWGIGDYADGANDHPENTPSSSYYWSSEEYSSNTDNANSLHYDNSITLEVSNENKAYGYQVRCVK
jgi:uncharacterized protein (TIGR02145 family)